jgi:hypothetical protein
MALNYTPGERADKSKRTRAQRLKDNKGTKDGAIRPGVKGKYYNRYDAKTGTWRRVTSKTTPTWETPKPKAKPVSSGTVTSAVATGKRGGKGSGNGTPAGTVQGRGGIPSEVMAQSRRAARGERRPPVPGTAVAATKNKAAADRRNAGRDAAAIAGLTVAPLIAGGVAGLAGSAAARGAAAAAAAGRPAIAAGGRAALPAGRRAVTASGRVARTTPRPAPARVTLTDLRGQATARGVASGQVPKAAIGRGTLAQRTDARRAVMERNRQAAAQRATAARTAKDRVQTQAAGSGVHPNTGGPATRAGNPARVTKPARPTAAQQKKLAAYEKNRPAKLAPGATRTSPVGNPRLNGAGRTGPKTQAQAAEAARYSAAAARSAAAKKAAATRAANKLRGMK